MKIIISTKSVTAAIIIAFAIYCMITAIFNHINNKDLKIIGMIGMLCFGLLGIFMVMLFIGLMFAIFEGRLNLFEPKTIQIGSKTQKREIDSLLSELGHAYVKNDIHTQERIYNKLKELNYF